MTEQVYRLRIPALSMLWFYEVAETPEKAAEQLGNEFGGNYIFQRESWEIELCPIEDLSFVLREARRLRRENNKLFEKLCALFEKQAELEAQLRVACHVNANDRVGFDWDILGKIADLEMENARLNSEIAGLKITAGGIDFYVAKNLALKARIARLESILKRANDITNDWVLCEYDDGEKELLDCIAPEQWMEE